MNDVDGVGRKPIHTADEIRGAAVSTVTGLRADMKATSKNLALSIVGEATDKLFAIANNPAVDGPYDDKGEASVTLKLEKLPEGPKVIEWLDQGKKLPVLVAPILEKVVAETFKDAAKLEVLGYSVAQTTISHTALYSRSYDEVVAGSYTLKLKLQDPQYATDPVLSSPANP